MRERVDERLVESVGPRRVGGRAGRRGAVGGQPGRLGVAVRRVLPDHRGVAPKRHEHVHAGVTPERADDVGHRRLVLRGVGQPAHRRAVAIHRERHPEERRLPAAEERRHLGLERLVRVGHPEGVVVTAHEDVIDVDAATDPHRSAAAPVRLVDLRTRGVEPPRGEASVASRSALRVGRAALRVSTPRRRRRRSPTGRGRRRPAADCGGARVVRAAARSAAAAARRPRRCSTLPPGTSPPPELEPRAAGEEEDSANGDREGGVLEIHARSRASCVPVAPAPAKARKRPRSVAVRATARGSRHPTAAGESPQLTASRTWTPTRRSGGSTRRPTGGAEARPTRCPACPEPRGRSSRSTRSRVRGPRGCRTTCLRETG